jgi:dipeptide/tripeptide permease
MGIGTGGFKSNISPLIAEQYKDQKAYVRVKKNGTKEIVDPATTTARICMTTSSLKSLQYTDSPRYLFLFPYQLRFSYRFHCYGLFRTFRGFLVRSSSYHIYASY